MNATNFKFKTVGAALMFTVVIAVAGCSKTDPTTATATDGKATASDGKPSVPELEGTVTTIANPTTTVTPTTLKKATGLYAVVEYPDGMDCPGDDRVTLKDGWGGKFTAPPPGNVGGPNSPGPIELLGEAITKVGSDHFDVITVGCGKWKDRSEKGAYNVAESWDRNVTLSLLVYHVTDDGTRDRRVSTQTFNREWLPCELRDSKDPNVAEVACDSLMSPEKQTVVATVAVSGDGQATVSPTGKTRPGRDTTGTTR